MPKGSLPNSLGGAGGWAIAKSEDSCVCTESLSGPTACHSNSTGLLPNIALRHPTAMLVLS